MERPNGLAGGVIINPEVFCNNAHRDPTSPHLSRLTLRELIAAIHRSGNAETYPARNQELNRLATAV